MFSSRHSLKHCAVNIHPREVGCNTMSLSSNYRWMMSEAMGQHDVLAVHSQDSALRSSKWRLDAFAVPVGPGVLRPWQISVPFHSPGVPFVHRCHSTFHRVSTSPFLLEWTPCPPLLLLLPLLPTSFILLPSLLSCLPFLLFSSNPTISYFCKLP